MQQFHLVDCRVLNSCPLYRGLTFFEFQGSIVVRCANNLFSTLLENVTDRFQYVQHEKMTRQVLDLRCGSSFFSWYLVRFKCALNSTGDYWQPSIMGLTWLPSAFEPDHDNLHCFVDASFVKLAASAPTPFAECMSMALDDISEISD